MPITGEFFKEKTKQRLRGCDRKLGRYRCEGEGVKAAERLFKKTGIHTHEYKCQFCSYWHIGHDQVDRKIELRYANLLDNPS